MDYTAIMRSITDKAKKGAQELAVMDREMKDSILLAMAAGIDSSRDEIKKVNELDLKAAREKGQKQAFIERLELKDKGIDGMCSMLHEVAELDDPVGYVLEKNERPNGLIIEKVRVPIGVIGIIYESRPNVTSDCIALCLKSGNSVILRGGSDAIRSNKAIYDIMKKAADTKGLADGAFNLIEDTSRKLVDAMLKSTGAIDLIMPRGGESLINEVVEKSRVPVIKHYKGLCHIYVDSDADLDMAENICINAKVQRPGVCNAMETMLVNEKVAVKFLPSIAEKLIEKGVKLKGCEKTRNILGDKAEAALDEDFATEWLDLILNIRVVSSLDEAIDHISVYGSDHSDAIITNNPDRGKEFTKRVDSAAVYVNASTRFTDGGEFGKGAEIGISTDKLHARGPMGLEELCIYKYIIKGTGQIRE